MHFVLVNPKSTSPTHDSAQNLLSEPPSDVVLKGHRYDETCCQLVQTISSCYIFFSLYRVVLAARSEWFRRALQSGMVEDRDRR